MKVYVLYTSYPHEGGYIHGVFGSREKAQEALDSEDFEWGEDNSFIEELTIDEFDFQGIDI